MSWYLKHLLLNICERNISFKTDFFYKFSPFQIWFIYYFGTIRPNIILRLKKKIYRWEKNFEMFLIRFFIF